MTKNDYKRPVIVGAFILVGLVILFVGVFTVGSQGKLFKKVITLQAVFDDVSGLQPGNNIWLSGVKVGTVKEIVFCGPSAVKVTMNIEKTAQPYLYKDAQARISTDGFIGNKIIIIYGGNTTAGRAANGDILKTEKSVSTAELLASIHVSSKNVQQITEDFKAVTGKIASGEGTMGGLINDRTLLQNLQATVDHLKGASAKTEAAVTNFHQFSTRLADQKGLVNELLTDTLVFKDVTAIVAQFKESAATVSASMDNLLRATEALKEKNNTAGMLLQDDQLANDIKETIINLKSSSQKLDEDLEALQHNFLLRGFFKNKKKAK